MSMENYHGTIYKNGNRYWWKVRFPGDEKFSFIPLKPKGSKFSTKDLVMAEKLARDLWDENLRKGRAIAWDGKLATLIKMYHAHNKEYYLPPSKEAYRISLGIFPLSELYPDILADDFTPPCLKKFMSHVVESDKYNWCRKLINERIRIIKRMFKWAASEMLVSIHTYTALTTVEGLRRGRTIARESKKVLPADIEAVKAVVAIVTTVVNDMIRVQLLTGMRSGELCKMRPIDIDRSGDIWYYKPSSNDPDKYAHKTAYLGHDKTILLGPKAQEILSKYLFRNPNDYCFKPEESYRQFLKHKSENRKTPLSCGNRPGTNRKGTRKFNDCFDSDTYMKTIKRACKAAGVEAWHPHQLRHNAATLIRKEFGLDAARAVLGHKTMAMTDNYAELDLQKANTVAKMIG